MTDDVLTLHEVAEQLGVHYMTAYRYVRLGMIEAVKSGGVWQVQPSELDLFRQRAIEAAAVVGPSGKGGPRNRRAPWAARLESRLVAGDALGSWNVVEAAMVAGTELDGIYIDVLTPALTSIGARWASGELDVSVEHRATGIAMRIVGRIGPRFTRRGRPRGLVALGAPVGEFHSLPIVMLSDLLRLRGWEVSEFGVNTPTASVGYVVRETNDLMAIGLCAMSADNLPALAEACAEARAADPDVLVIAGGRAVTDDSHAVALGAHAYAADHAEMHTLLLNRAAATHSTH